jgi:hypothetical protein
MLQYTIPPNNVRIICSGIVKCNLVKGSGWDEKDNNNNYGGLRAVCPKDRMPAARKFPASRQQSYHVVSVFTDSHGESQGRWY